MLQSNSWNKFVSLKLRVLLSRFSHVWLCATPETAAHQAPPLLGFSRQEHWSGLPFPSPMHESEKWKWSHSVVSDSSDPMDCSLPGSSVHGIFQAKVLEWGAIAGLWDECNCVVVWTFFVIAFLWDWNENDIFQSCGHCWVFQICWHIECSNFTASSFRIWNSSTGIPSPPLALFEVMLPKAH